MNYLESLTNNTQIAIWSSIYGGIASYSFFEYGYYQIPFVDYDIPSFLVYGAMVGVSSFLLKNTGDFILPLISNNTQFNSLSKLTIPLSVGIISVGTLFILNGFDIPSMNDTVKMILLSGDSYIVADWTFSKLYSMYNTNTITNNNNMKISPPVNLPNVPNVPINNVSPSPMIPPIMLQPSIKPPPLIPPNGMLLF